VPARCADNLSVAVCVVRAACDSEWFMKGFLQVLVFSDTHTGRSVAVESQHLNHFLPHGIPILESLFQSIFMWHLFINDVLFSVTVRCFLCCCWCTGQDACQLEFCSGILPLLFELPDVPLPFFNNVPVSLECLVSGRFSPPHSPVCIAVPLKTTQRCLY